MSALVMGRRRLAAGREAYPRLGVLGWTSAGFLALIALIAVFAPLITPQDPLAIDLGNAHVAPGTDYFLGSDANGRDILSRLIVGSRTSLLGPLGVVALAAAAGSTIAIASAWIGGRFDQIVVRVVDAWFSFPGILLAILAVAVFGSGLMAPVIALAISYIPYSARVTRSGAIRERRLPYVEALQVQGFSAWRICTRHLLPNLAPLIVAQATVAFGYAMVDLAAISFLGLGVQPPTPDWGLMVSQGKNGILQGHPQETLFAGLAIVLTVLAFNLLGDRISRVYQERS
ncbi:MAG: peptide/nickel transport system permease protein [Thermoleophilaceae bacterium]|jgi:peptide/nickel transport system permease protein|nr:peptide/nickel transport system permease protein [Thermoleophilaceae bacterium]MEA2402906.1 peptide/nickel transport system permease protein [Thermoleophilaceae bacterium]MEA2454353.1 peptide/nickel transport system permease protein [Thermoleophilaceae bacterium]